MKRYRRIGVFLTGLPADGMALGYAGRFAMLAESEKVLCVYVHGDGLEGPGWETIDVEDLREQVISRLPAATSQGCSLSSQNPSKRPAAT